MEKNKIKSTSQWKLNKGLKPWGKITCNELKFFSFYEVIKLDSLLTIPLD